MPATDAITVADATMAAIISALEKSAFALQSYTDAAWSDKTVPLRAEVLKTVADAKAAKHRAAPISPRALASF